MKAPSGRAGRGAGPRSMPVTTDTGPCVLGSVTVRPGWYDRGSKYRCAAGGRAMIEFGRGDLLGSETEALVNAVNTVGVMGKGVALQFKQAFPQNYRAYRLACQRAEVQLGRMFVWDSG